MRPMLARTYGPKYNNFPCYVQPKLNGVRALYQKEVFQSRDEKIWKNPVVEHLVSELSTISDMLDVAILDGEFYVHGWKLQRINGAIAVNRKEPSDDTPHVCFHVFDVVNPNGSFSKRWFGLYNVLGSIDKDLLPHIHAVPTALCTSREDLEFHFHLYTKLGYEGIMLRPDGPYEYGEHQAKSGLERMTQFRSEYLWKHKQWEDDEFTCIGVTQGEGKADIGIGALVLRANYNKFSDPKVDGEMFKVGTGFSDEDRIEFSKKPPVGKLVRVRYLCLTNDGIPFNPSFIAVME